MPLKKRKLLIWVLIAMGAIVVCAGIYSFINSSPAENSDLRKAIEGSYYSEYSYEDCVMFNASEYTSKEDCENALRCIAADYANLIPEKDLKDLTEYMGANGAEMGYIYYLEKHPKIDSEMELIFTKCLSGKHEDYI